MPAELHIRIHPNAQDPGSIVEQFPFEPGQQAIFQSMELIIIDLGDANDTNYVQDWYLNAHDGVASFFVAGDDLSEDEPSSGEDEA